MTFMEALKEARKKKNYTLFKLSTLSNVTIQNLKNTEAGAHIPPGFEITRRLEEALELEVGELLRYAVQGKSSIRVPLDYSYSKKELKFLTDLLTKKIKIDN